MRETHCERSRRVPEAEMSLRTTGLLLLAVGMAFPPTAAAAQEEAPRPLRITAHNLNADDARHRALAERGRSAGTVLPGDVVRYRLTFTNTTEREVRDVEFVDPVPEGFVFVGGSASADRRDVRIEYSADGGRSFSRRPVAVEVVDGERVERPVKPERYTHVRWTVTGWVQPGAQVTAEFDVRLPASGDGGDS